MLNSLLDVLALLGSMMSICMNCDINVFKYKAKNNQVILLCIAEQINPVSSLIVRKNVVDFKKY